MSTSTAPYKLIKEIKDEKFDVDSIEHYNLSIQIGIRDLQICLIDTRDNKCLLLEDFVLGKASSYPQLVEQLNILFDDHYLLKVGFWKTVKISIKSSKYTFIPESLFDHKSLESYLSANCHIDPNIESFLFYQHIKSKAVNVFAVNKRLANWVTSLYPNSTVQITHQASALIEGVLKERKPSQQTIYLYVDRFKLHVISAQKGELEYYNQFPIKKFEDYMKYIGLVMQGLGYQQENCQVVMWGYLGKKSPHFLEFSKYIKNITFGSRPRYLTYGYIFDEVQDHHFYDLYSIYLCN